MRTGASRLIRLGTPVMNTSATRSASKTTGRPAMASTRCRSRSVVGEIWTCMRPDSIGCSRSADDLDFDAQVELTPGPIRSEDHGSELLAQGETGTVTQGKAEASGRLAKSGCLVSSLDVEGLDLETEIVERRLDELPRRALLCELGCHFREVDCADDRSRDERGYGFTSRLFIEEGEESRSVQDDTT